MGKNGRFEALTAVLQRFQSCRNSSVAEIVCLEDGEEWKV
jgi:hypothetical protein